MKQKDKALILREEIEPTEFGLIDELASLLGLKRATALKMHLRETLPMRIAQLKAARQAKSGAVA